ncbi:MAG: formylglycine-generating enzyme family protein [Alphaproteobacteria bacterium]
MSAPRRNSYKRSPKSPSRARGRGTVLRTFTFDTVTLDGEGRVIARRRADAQQLIQRLGKDVTLHMVQIPGGTFVMGAPDGEPGAKSSERPQHQVTVAPFYLGKVPVTLDQWRAVMGARPPAMKIAEGSFRKSGRQPAVRVSFDEVEEFCARLSRKARRIFRLPTEAEWEYGCRAGTSSAFAFGPAITRDLVIHGGEAIRQGYANGTHATTRPVGSLRVANAFGLFDMHGQVWEWCQDWWHGHYENAPADARAWTGGGALHTRVLRGGSWYAAADLCRSASRMMGGETGIRSRQIGLRVAMGV